jgi:outer membrane lipoprotein-sorting protein
VGLLAWLALPAITRAEQNERLLDAWLTAQTNFHTWSAEFTQTRTLKALAQPLTTHGRVWFAAPDRFRWELGEPAQTIAVRGPEQLLVIYPRLKRAERYPLTGAQHGAWRDALVLLESGFPRSRADLDAKFRILSTSNVNDRCEVTLQPKAPGARKLMPQLRVAFATNDLSLRMTALKFADGSTLRNEFTNACRNPALEGRLFSPALDTDVKVVEPLGDRGGERLNR